MKKGRSIFLDLIGAPKVDLRVKPKCAICGIPITRKNYTMGSNAWDNGGWTPTKYYCGECFLKPEALGVPNAKSEESEK